MRDIEPALLRGRDSIAPNVFLTAQTGQLSLMRTVAVEVDESTPPAVEAEAAPQPEQIA